MKTVTRTRRAVMTAVAGLAFMMTAGIGSLEALFAPDPDLWPRWQERVKGSTLTIDHGTWDRLLGTYVSTGPDGVNRFAYGRVTPADRQALKSYLESLSAIRIGQYDRPEQFAFWVNLYNALTIKVILDNMPVETIRNVDIAPGLFSSGPWDAPLITVAGEPVTLNDIEHRILRPIWRDPRIHYAVNCASIGCPNLQTDAFTGANTAALLGAGARDYVNHPRGVAIEGDRLIVSSIYVWFKEDFGGSDAGVISHLRRYANPALNAALARHSRIDDHRYDWSLNAPVGGA